MNNVKIGGGINFKRKTTYFNAFAYQVFCNDFLHFFLLYYQSLFNSRLKFIFYNLVRVFGYRNLFQ